MRRLELLGDRQHLPTSLRLQMPDEIVGVDALSQHHAAALLGVVDAIEEGFIMPEDDTLADGQAFGFADVVRIVDQGEMAALTRGARRRRGGDTVARPVVLVTALDVL